MSIRLDDFIVFCINTVYSVYSVFLYRLHFKMYIFVIYFLEYYVICFFIWTCGTLLHFYTWICRRNEKRKNTAILNPPLPEGKDTEPPEGTGKTRERSPITTAANMGQSDEKSILRTNESGSINK